MNLFDHTFGLHDIVIQHFANLNSWDLNNSRIKRGGKKKKKKKKHIIEYDSSKRLFFF